MHYGILINNEKKSTNNTEEPLELKIDGTNIQDPEIIATHITIFFINVTNTFLAKNPTT